MPNIDFATSLAIQTNKWCGVPSLPSCLLHLPYNLLIIKKVGLATNGCIWLICLVFGDVLQDIHDDRRWNIHLNQLPNSLHRNINLRQCLGSISFWCRSGSALEKNGSESWTFLQDLLIFSNKFFFAYLFAET